MTKKTQTNQPLMEQLLQSKQPAAIRKGVEVEAEILQSSKKGVIFDLGSKAHAVLGDRELKDATGYLPHLKVGTRVKVRIISEESKDGYPVVSMRAFFNDGKWEILRDKKEKEEEIEVVCGEYGKGGVFIEFMGIRGVIPKIQLTQDYINEPEKLTGQRIKVRVLEVDPAKNRLVVSQKASVLNISHKDLKVKFDKIKAGDKCRAMVLGFSEFGIFCEVEGVEGLVHISEISWEKVTDVGPLVQVGKEIDVMVVEKNEEDLKLNLSIKRLANDPWDSIEEKYPKDREVDGEIVRHERYGYFVRLEPGIEGLIHSSKLNGTEQYEVGHKIKAFIERVNKQSRRLSLIPHQSEKPVMYR